MFENCTSLTIAPDLPAINLNTACYDGMFQGCTSLVTAPEILPATRLYNNCYSLMFNGCTSLVKAPELPATSWFESGCYDSMFYNCSSLNYIKMLAGSVSTRIFSDWVYGVSPTGTFVKNSAATWDESKVIPEGWTVETVDV
jgi:hypothetical protein